MKHVYLWTALAIATLVAVIVLLRMNAPLYYPKVAIALPGNITMTVIAQPWNSEAKCAQKYKAISASVSGKCLNCNIKASCLVALDMRESQALRGKAINRPVVYTTTAITIIDAETKEAMSICNSIATQATKEKIQHVRCIAPEVTR